MKFGIFSIIILFLAIVLLGCDNNVIEPSNSLTNGFSLDGITSTEITGQSTDTDYKNAELPIKGEMNVYKLSRKVFFEFIETPSIEILNTKNSGVHSYPSEGEKIYETSGVFKIEQSFVDFVDVESIQRYLSDNGYDVPVETVSVFRNESLPVCIWIITTEENFAITINEMSDDYYSDEPYVYRLYTQAQFVDKFSRIEGRAVINGKSLPDDSIVYIYHNYAEVPLLASLECYGAKTISYDGNIAKLSYNGDVYCLEIKQHKLYKEGNDINIFPGIDGGVTYMYSHGNDIMVDDWIFRLIVRELTDNLSKMNMDKENGLVEIK